MSDTITGLYDKLLAGWHNVQYPYPDRRLKGVISVQYRGDQLFCRHEYRKMGFHEEILDNTHEPIRMSIRHYQCVKCNRKVHVIGRRDDESIKAAIRRYRSK